jgi:outer membrane immunogenic protein
MKQILLATASVLALAASGPAMSADLRMPVKAPPIAPVPVFSWTGCYIGGHIGGGWGRKTFADTSRGDLIDFFSDEFFASSRVDTSGFLGGGQVGCDYQFAPNWVIGVEGSGSWADISGSTTFPDGSEPATTLHAKTDWLASATARLGYAWDRWMLYAKGGAAWAGDKYSLAAYLDTWRASETRTGWTVGAGLEWAFAGNWSAKLEYDYYDFGSKDLNFTTVSGQDPAVERIKQQIHTVKLGINWHFNTAPVTARY